MRQKIFIFLALIGLVILLVGLNAVSFVQREKTPDSEFAPNRSTYNAGATGTRALFDLLAETGRNPVRWQQPISSLAAAADKNQFSTFIIVGQTRREISDTEIEQLLDWVAAGGKLVVIDREPPERLLETSADWKIFAVPSSKNATPFSNLDPSDKNQMTEKTAAAKPVQPTVITEGVNAVQPSRFASSISQEYQSENESVITTTGAPNNEKSGETIAPTTKKSAENVTSETAVLSAPVVHLSNGEKNLLVDFPYEAGEIVFLSDPYIVSNGGVNLVDNAQLAINILTARGGVIAFDEYHQGYGASGNRLFEYFAGTPLAAFLLQLMILSALFFAAKSLRFARPLPPVAPNRLSKLEYVSAMAQLQQRTRAYDLAIENIYTDFRRRAARSLGVDNYAVSLREMARLIAERTAETNAADIENLMFKCEEIIRGEPTGKREVLQITTRLRQLEDALGLKRQRTARK